MDHSLPISLAAEPVFMLGSFAITNALLTNVILAIILLSMLYLFPQRTSYIPEQLQNFCELVYEQLLNLVESVIDNKKVISDVLPIVATFFVYIVTSNWLGLVPGIGSIGIYEMHDGHNTFIPLLRGSNSDLNQTIVLGFISIFAIQWYGFKYQGLQYFKKFFNLSNPIYTFVGLLELLSEIVKIFSFAFRLYGNIFAGEVLLIVVSGLSPFLAPVPFLGLELFTGLIQALVFTMLTVVFLRTATESHVH
ncbi:MAG: F0F1 ATP synthase subunit A [Candidatus Abawacabacteria bacterium]|nr:F0F1 ATP synthase subunit A [Candidatus Abawacabacteria bacterium]